MAFVAIAVVLAEPAHAEPAPAERLLAIVDYVRSDYSAAVANGRIVAPAEYQEQRGLLEEARSLTVIVSPRPSQDAARAALAAQVEQLVTDFGAKAAEARIAADCEALSGRLFDDDGLAVAPRPSHSAEGAPALYATNCAPCHGDDGRAQTEKARTLIPPPVSLLNAERMSRISPRAAFEALTFGVNNTAMASFEALSADQRWSLAFEVVGWRHRSSPEVLERGAALFRSSGVRLAVTPSRLSELADQDIEARLAPVLAAPADREAVLAWLRAGAGFPHPEGSFRTARALLLELDAFATERIRAADISERVVSVGVQPHLLILLLRNSSLARRVTQQLASLRRVAGEGDPGAVRRETIRSSVLLDRAEECDEGGAAALWSAAMVGGAGSVAPLALLIALVGARGPRRMPRALLLAGGTLAWLGMLLWALVPVWEGILEEAGGRISAAGGLAGAAVAVVAVWGLVAGARRLRAWASTSRGV